MLGEGGDIQGGRLLSLLAKGGVIHLGGVGCPRVGQSKSMKIKKIIMSVHVILLK